MTRKELSIKEIQAVSLEILKQIADLCDELNLRYYLCWGTLLGAIRHHGFIPWDDDVDIMMPRQDYDMLLEYLYHHKLPNLTLFSRKTNPQYPYMISRISDDRYIIEAENEKAIGMGVFIDIYPLDGMGNSLEEAVHYGKRTDRLSSLCFQASRKHFAIENTKTFARIALKLPVFIVAKIIGKDYFMDKIEKYTGKYSYEDSEWVGDVVWLNGGPRGYDEIIKKEWINEFVMMPFEKYEFKVPKMYHEALTHTYGDYMQLPPENERVGHHFYKAYRK